MLKRMTGIGGGSKSAEEGDEKKDTRFLMIPLPNHCNTFDQSFLFGDAFFIYCSNSGGTTKAKRGVIHNRTDEDFSQFNKVIPGHHLISGRALVACASKLSLSLLQDRIL